MSESKDRDSVTVLRGMGNLFHRLAEVDDIMRKSFPDEPLVGMCRQLSEYVDKVMERFSIYTKAQISVSSVIGEASFEEKLLLLACIKKASTKLQEALAMTQSWLDAMEARAVVVQKGRSAAEEGPRA